MGVEIGYNVFLPRDYEDNDVRYPALYFLHGAGGDENSDAIAFSGLLARLTSEGKLPPLIAVFPNGGNRSGYRDHPERNVLVETSLMQELIPFIDATYRTRSHPEARAILGFSIGGAGALRLALRHPHVFRAAGSWGGAFGGRHDMRLPPEFSAETLALLSGRVRVVLVVGTEDFTLRSHSPLLRNLLEAKFPLHFELLADVGHDPGAYYDHSGETMLRFLTLGF